MGLELSRHRLHANAARPACRKFQILRGAFISRLMYSACRRARATMVRVGLAAPAWSWRLPSEINRFLMSCVWPQAFRYALARVGAHAGRCMCYASRRGWSEHTRWPQWPRTSGTSASGRDCASLGRSGVRPRGHWPPAGPGCPDVAVQRDAVLCAAGISSPLIIMPAIIPIVLPGNAKSRPHPYGRPTRAESADGRVTVHPVAPEAAAGSFSASSSMTPPVSRRGQE